MSETIGFKCPECSVFCRDLEGLHEHVFTKHCWDFPYGEALEVTKRMCFCVEVVKGHSPRESSKTVAG